MKYRRFKRVLVAFCVLSLFATLMATFVSAASYTVVFSTSVPSSWGWSQAEIDALNYLEVDSAARDSSYSYSSFNGQTLTFLSDYVDGDECVLVFYNTGYYNITLGVARSSPWAYQTEITIPAATGEFPGMAVLKVSSVSYTNLTIYTASTLKPTYAGTPEGYFNANIVYYDFSGTRWEHFEMVNIQPSDIVNGYYTLPLVDGYIVVPQKVYIGSMPSTQITIEAFLYDDTLVNQQAYQSGYNQGSQDASKDMQSQIDSSYNNGYDAGLQAGLLQNELTYSQIQNVRTDYNVFTAFFDGIFSGLIQLWNTVTNGISFGGVSLNMVITTLIVIAVVVLLSSFVINRL